MKNKKTKSPQEQMIAELKSLYKNKKPIDLINCPPPDKWVKTHDTIKNVKYIPISIIENLLLLLFKETKIEVISYSQLFSAASCHVRLHYLKQNSADKKEEWMYHDGLGAAEIDNKATTTSHQFAMTALPTAKSFAITDAAHHLGALFGRDLNRKQVAEEKIAEEKYNWKTLRELFDKNKYQLTKEEIDNCTRIIDKKEETSFEKLNNYLKTK